MEIKTFFLDTYALYEIIEGNENYIEYTKNVAIVTTKINIMELFYGLLIKYNEKVADNFYEKFLPYCTGIEDNVIKKAMTFRALNKKRNLSYVDCIGYIIAKQRNIKFLTGDKEFEYMENVEFVK
ncbi:PIN domain-containing protein [Candidatus Woesearchaeota archaeon]|nr:PIN domain-containing protein [Candidatus Woesearchaeota archaeon]